MSQSSPPGLILAGRWSHRGRGLWNLIAALLAVSARRAINGPRAPGWTAIFEVITAFVRRQTEIAFDCPSMAEGRAYEDAVLFPSAVLSQVTIEPVTAPVKGHWFTPKAGARAATLLYLHGGGYAYYSKSHANLIALAALSLPARTFALDYRLIPEHPFPAQLEDAVAAYRWLLDAGVAPRQLILMGDSAGANLTLALLLKLRDLGWPLPAGAVALCPWTDVGNTVSPVSAMAQNDPFDFPQSRMVLRWAGWLCREADVRDPLVSPIYADWRGLPPVYVQAGKLEILADQIIRFVERAQAQGADITFDCWESMNHDFQAFGDLLPESIEAWERIKLFAERISEIQPSVSVP
ncbi:MAG: alpha/beta hydrolase [Anaerolineae bacterium]|nr:alpha/beta hydrolase [Anaerolineae bacterium]